MAMGHLPTVTRLKVKVSSVLRELDNDGQVSKEIVKLCAVSSNTEENAKWSKWSPCANIEIHISNADAFGKLSRGHEFFVDFIPAQNPAQNPEE